MKHLRLAALAALLAFGGSGVQASDGAAYIGTWALDLGSMPIPPEARPDSVTVSFVPEGTDGLHTTFVITAKNGSERRMVSREKLDGVAVSIEGDTLEADSAALTSPAPGVLVMGLSKSGRPGSVRVYTVAPDGASMTESAVNVGDDGRPFIRRFRWLRVI